MRIFIPFQVFLHSLIDFGQYDDRETRGNGNYRKPKNYQTSFYFSSDQRNDIVIEVGQEINWDSKLKKRIETDIEVQVKPL